ncbi:hypothetical protein BGX38DRAFT_1211531, partial [Terfezia claveryi]
LVLPPRTSSFPANCRISNHGHIPHDFPLPSCLYVLLNSDWTPPACVAALRVSDSPPSAASNPLLNKKSSLGREKKPLPWEYRILAGPKSLLLQYKLKGYFS